MVTEEEHSMASLHQDFYKTIAQSLDAHDPRVSELLAASQRTTDDINELYRPDVPRQQENRLAELFGSFVVEESERFANRLIIHKVLRRYLGGRALDQEALFTRVESDYPGIPVAVAESVLHEEVLNVTHLLDSKTGTISSAGWFEVLS